MAGETEFPKTNGDIFFASEANQLMLGDAFARTPTLDGTWATNPTNLTNITDNDDATVTGTGISDSDNDSFIRIDTGINKKRGFIGFKIGLWVDTNGGNTSDCKIDVSEDGSSWTGAQTVDANITDTSENINTGAFDFSTIRFRHIRIDLHGAATDDGTNIKVYSIDTF